MPRKAQHIAEFGDIGEHRIEADKPPPELRRNHLRERRFARLARACQYGDRVSRESGADLFEKRTSGDVHGRRLP